MHWFLALIYNPGALLKEPIEYAVQNTSFGVKSAKSDELIEVINEADADIDVDDLLRSEEGSNKKQRNKSAPIESTSYFLQLSRKSNDILDKVPFESASIDKEKDLQLNLLAKIAHRALDEMKDFDDLAIISDTDTKDFFDRSKQKPTLLTKIITKGDKLAQVKLEKVATAKKKADTLRRSQENMTARGMKE